MMEVVKLETWIDITSLRQERLNKFLTTVVLQLCVACGYKKLDLHFCLGPKIAKKSRSVKLDLQINVMIFNIKTKMPSAK